MEKEARSFLLFPNMCECTYKYLCVYICVWEEGRTGKGTWEKKREPIEARRDRLLRHSCNFPVVSRLVNSRWNMRRGAWCGQHAAALPCSPLTHTLVHSPPPPFTPSIGAAVARGLSLPSMALQRFAAGCEIPGISLICSITFANSRSFSRLVKKKIKSHKKNIKPKVGKFEENFHLTFLRQSIFVLCLNVQLFKYFYVSEWIDKKHSN